MVCLSFSLSLLPVCVGGGWVRIIGKSVNHICAPYTSPPFLREGGGSSAVFFFASSLLQRSVCCVVAFVGYTANCYSSPSLISEKAPRCKCL